MQLELEVFSHFCATKHFRINGVWANSSEFGEQGDVWDGEVDEYYCGDMRFVRHDPPPPEILDKYRITASEYAEICDKLEEDLSFGNCGLCS